MLMPKAVCCELCDLYLSSVIPVIKIREIDVIWQRQTQKLGFVAPSPVSRTY